MSALVVISVEELRRIVAEAVAEALASGPRQSSEWVAVRRAGLPPTAIRRLARDGTLRSIILGRERFVSREDLEKYLESLAADSRKKEPTVPRGTVAHDPKDLFEVARVRARLRRAS